MKMISENDEIKKCDGKYKNINMYIITTYRGFNTIDVN